MDLSQTIRYLESNQKNVSLGNQASDGTSSMTVQTVLLHPLMERSVYWVLNRQETEKARQGIFNTSKPSGWGNPGGGVELIDCVNERGASHSFEKTLVSCGKRELVDETGFTHFEFKRNTALELPFVRYDDSFGHCVITLLAQLYDYQSIPVKEAEEIMCGSWFDLSISPVELFRSKTDLPYWSHVRRTIIVLNHLAQDTDTNNMTGTIHPLWNLVFPITTQDVRFPKLGYLIPPQYWYRIMRMLIMDRVHALDLDFIYSHLGPKIDERRRQENDRLFAHKRAETISAQQVFPRSNDFPLMSEQEKMIAEYEEDYRRWAENAA